MISEFPAQFNFYSNAYEKGHCTSLINVNDDLNKYSLDVCLFYDTAFSGWRNRTKEEAKAGELDELTAATRLNYSNFSLAMKCDITEY